MVETNSLTVLCRAGTGAAHFRPLPVARETGRCAICAAADLAGEWGGAPANGPLHSPTEPQMSVSLRNSLDIFHVLKYFYREWYIH